MLDRLHPISLCVEALDVNKGIYVVVLYAHVFTR
uniref:Uncharacterized protein n=1 Tax=Anguilla anguilla TaxID=7936 RepID=A0A0E9RK83_ANGAN